MAKTYKWGYVGMEGEWVIEPRFDDAWPFSDGLAAVRVEWARGYIGRDGAWVMEPRFQVAGPFCDGRAGVMFDDVWGYVDKAGVFTPDPEAEAAARYAPEATDNPELLSTGKYADAGGFHDGLARVRTSAGGKWQYIREDGKGAFKGRFDGAEDFHDGLAAVMVKMQD